MAIQNKLTAIELKRTRDKLEELKVKAESLDYFITDNTLRGFVTLEKDRNLLQSIKLDIEWLEAELRGTNPVIS